MFPVVTYEHNHECQRQGEQFVHRPPFVENWSFVVPEFRCVEFPNDELLVVSVEIEGEIPAPVPEPEATPLEEENPSE